MGVLHIVLIPAMAHGHMIPILDMAKLFASRGLKTTIIATPTFAASVERARESGHDINLSIINFPPEKSSLPDNIVRFDQMSTLDSMRLFTEAMFLLQEPVEKLLQELNPDCVVSDSFFPWTVDSAAKLGIPRLVFHGVSCLALCVSEQMRLHKPYRNASSGSETFIVPNIPHRLTFVRTQVPIHEVEGHDQSHYSNFVQLLRDSDQKSYGVIVNSFRELESDYADHYKNIMGRKAWHIGPLLLCNKNNKGSEERIEHRGKESSINEHECLAWLDSKKPDSVVYVCSGSMVTFTPAQLHETAAGLEASGQDFIWVISQGKHDEDEKPEEDLLPQGFEDRTKGKGLIIRGWAPQVMILDHPSVGAFMTHCGWNSTLEGICAGVSMVTWPAFAEQFFNEKLVTEVLETGISVGNKRFERWAVEGVPREAVETAVRRIMAADEMRSRAKCYKEMARKAVEEGGSSYSDLNALIDELSLYVPNKKQDIN